MSYGNLGYHLSGSLDVLTNFSLDGAFNIVTLAEGVFLDSHPL